MPETIQDASGNVSPIKVGRKPKEDTRGGSISVDQEHRDQMDQWVDRYYPGARVNLTDILHEMMDLAHAVASADSQRAETAEQRRARLSGAKP